jgi:antitoxin VapB
MKHEYTMALNIKDRETERLATEVAKLAGESKTGAIRTALAERRDRLILRVPRGSRRERIMRLLEDEIWSSMPPQVLGKKFSRRAKERILGYGPEGM